MTASSPGAESENDNNETGFFPLAGGAMQLSAVRVRRSNDFVCVDVCVCAAYASLSAVCLCGLECPVKKCVWVGLVGFVECGLRRSANELRS